MADPDLFQFLRMIATEDGAIEFCRDNALIPAPQPVPHPARDHPRHAIYEYWGICGDIGFNPLLPQCDGRVTTTIRHFKNGPKPQFRCVKCRKQLSQLNGMQPVNPAARRGTWFAMLDAAGRPNTKVSKQAVLWITYAMSKGISVAHTMQYSANTIPLTTATIIDWRHYIRELFTQELERAAPMGGPGEVVEIDESLFRGKRKYNRGRMLLSNLAAGGGAAAAASGGAVAAAGGGAVAAAGGGAVAAAGGGAVAATGGRNRNHGRRMVGPCKVLKQQVGRSFLPKILMVFSYHSCLYK